MLQDFQYASRLLKSNPVFAVVAVLTLALGIGANTAIFSVMNAVVLRDMPVPNPDRLVYLRTSSLPRGSSQTGHTHASFNEPSFERLRTERQVFSDLVAFVPLGIPKVAVRYGKEPEEAAADMVGGNFFSGIGVQPVCGRTFAMEDETKHSQVAVLGYGYWTRRFAQSCDILGHPLYIKGVPFTIVGVAAKDFAGVESGGATDVWVPLQERQDLNAWGQQGEATLYGSPNWWCLMMLGRLAPGVDQAQALARLNPVFQRAAYVGIGGPTSKEKLPKLSFESARGIPGLREASERPLTILMAMVVLVLCIACGNVAMLLTARNAARRREFSVRMAVGGSRARLFRQLLAESAVLVAAGAALGWLFALAAARALGAWSQLDVNLAPDRTVLLFTFGVSLLAAFVFGLAPLRSVVRVPIGFVLKTSAATAYRDRKKWWGGNAVVALQISVCLTLIVCAGLLVGTLKNLEHVNLGLRTSGLLVFGINPQQRNPSDGATVLFYEDLLNRLRSMPGVEAATLMQNRLGSGWSNNTSANVDGKNPRGEGAASSPMRWNSVGPDYFHTLGTPMRYGRDFNEADTSSALKVAIINETFAERYFTKRNPLGHQVSFSRRAAAAPRYTIVGVAANSKYTGVREDDAPMAYFPYTQVPGIGTMHIELRTAGDPAAFLPAVRRAVAKFAPDLPLLQPMTQRRQFESSFNQERLIARLSMFFGLLATLLVATGLYGTLAYTVSRRTAEVGIRMALGARRSQVLWMILRESLVVCIIGSAAGVALAIAAGRLLQSMLYGVTPGDPATFVAALLGLALVCLLAGLIPARRAASVDPMVALRYE